MTQSFLSLGSNIEPEQHLFAALPALQLLASAPLQLSSVYVSAAVGFEGAPFYNLVVALETSLDAAALLAQCRAVEHAQGRQRTEMKFSARTLDIDLLLYGKQTGTVGSARLPHPDICRYPFVLLPLVELAADLQHPELGISYANLWGSFSPAAKASLHCVAGLRERWLTALKIPPHLP